MLSLAAEWHETVTVPSEPPSAYGVKQRSMHNTGRNEQHRRAGERRVHFYFDNGTSVALGAGESQVPMRGKV